jgi:ABC-2 type transport system ATP-binding protein
MEKTLIPNSGVLLEDVAKNYGRAPAVQGVDLHIAPGETVALLGPNGAGKSTTLDMVLGLARPDRGRVSLFGLPPQEAVRAGAVGGMLQTGSLISFVTVRELVAMVASLYPHPLGVDDVLRVTGTDDLAGRPADKLSGGQSQRVRFALALVGNPDLLVLDEPTAALDVEARRDFWSIMRGITDQGKTVIFATHYLEEADAYADRIVLMARGRVVADGSTASVKALVGRRTVRATVPDAETRVVSDLPGVSVAERRGATVVLSCDDADTALRALLARYPEARDIEVRGADLEDAFVELTADDGRLSELSELNGASR